MAKLHFQPNIELRVVVELTEIEARALEGIFGYNVEEFISTFKTYMGKHYIQGYEDGMRSLFKLRGELDSAITRKNQAFEVFTGRKIAIFSKREE